MLSMKNGNKRGIIQVDMGSMAAKLKLRRLCRAQDLTISQVVRKALRPFLSHPESPRA